MSGDAAIIRMVDQLVAQPPSTPYRLMAGIGAALPGVTEGQREADLRDPVRANGITFTRIEFRHSPVARAPLIVLEIARPCLSRAAVLERYRRLEPVDFPRTEDPDEQFTYARGEEWGRLAFGFRQGSLECLATIVLDLDRQR